MSSDERAPRRGITDEQIAAKVAESRAAQGLPPFIEDRTALAKVATILLSISAATETEGHR